MRSRLEASFAEWLDGDSSHVWQYESQCFASKDGQYLPDFHVYWGWRDDWEYCEVKPENADFDAALQRMHIILASEPLARLKVYTRTTSGYGKETNGFIPTDWCYPNQPCGACDRPTIPRDRSRS